MEKLKQLAHKLRYITKSKFLRTVFIQESVIFLLVSIAIVLIVFYSFAGEINQSLITERQVQLSVIEDTISKRMDEITSIAYNISIDPAFYLEPIEGERFSGREMSTTLARYLVGNGFIKYLAYYRVSEADIIYTSKGEVKFKEFWSGYLGVDEEKSEWLIEEIQKMNQVSIVAMSFGGKTYFAYVSPLPQLVNSPKAFVLMLIPEDEVSRILSTQLVSSSGAVVVFDQNNSELYRLSTLSDEEYISDETLLSAESGKQLRIDGREYVVQKQVSSENGFTYISAIRLNDLVAGLAKKQLVFIIIVMLLMLLGLLVVLLAVISQYQPIRELAAEAAGQNGSSRLDEARLLSAAFAELSSDSSQKQKYEAAYLQAQAESKAKSEFLSNMSHDIRTPMNAIIGMNAMAMKHADEPEYVLECLSKAEVASNYLLELINNVLDMSRIESGRFTLSRAKIDLRELFCGLFSIINQSLRAKGLRLDAEVRNVRNEFVLGDGVRLMQIFMNILSNAVKFTPEGGTISVSISQEETSEQLGSYVFRIADTGIGMSEEFVSHVFDTFTRADNPNVRQTEGTGLGMAIAQNLVSMMGGTIGVESELNVGTTFTVRLPLPLADDDREEAVDSLGDVRVLLLGERGLCEIAAAVFSEISCDTEILEPPSAARRLREAPSAPFTLAVLLYDSEQDAVNAMSLLAPAENAPTAFVLCALDLSNIAQTPAREAGISAFMQLPLFRSSAAELLRHAKLPKSEREKTDMAVADTERFEGLRVLLADDNEMNRLLAERILSETGATVDQAYDGQNAIDMFSAHEAGYYDVILMDLQMPILSGLDAAITIRGLARSDAEKIPIFALTASTFDEDVQRVLEAGMNGHIGKPYRPEELYEVLRTVKKTK